LNVNIQTGIIPSDLEERELAFGSNKKDPPGRTPFCTIFMNALGDFMLRILLVCACVSLIFDEAFATSNTERKTGKI
jgi:hypothetical protein